MILKTSIRLHTFLISALDGDEWSKSHSSLFIPKESDTCTNDNKSNLVLLKIYFKSMSKNVITTGTPSSRVLLEKLIIAQLVKKFPTFHVIQWFITVFRKTCHWSPS
jgi:hypothetical protein